MERDRALAMVDLVDADGDTTCAADQHSEVRMSLDGVELWGALAQLEANSIEERVGQLPAS